MRNTSMRTTLLIAAVLLAWAVHNLMSPWSPRTARAAVVPRGLPSHFGIGLSAGKWGWYAPILWTRTFAALTLFILAAIRRYQPRHSSWVVTAPEEKPVPLQTFGIGLAVVVGLLETAGLLLYSFDTQLASTGIASAISSSWGIIPLLAGITIFRERPALYQIFGVMLVLLGLFLLAIKPT